MAPNFNSHSNRSSFEAEPQLQPLFTEKHLKHLNEQLSKLPPKKILEWAIVTIPGLYQSTAFGLTGLVILDMISKISYEFAEENGTEPKHLIPLVFIDTLYHFPETLYLSKQASEKYNVDMHVYKPKDCETVEQFEEKYGKNLWENDDDIYDYLVKVEPARRSYQELKAKGIITGRRRSQKGERENIKILEVDGTGLIKLNPLANWDFQTVRTYIKANGIPYNALLDRGYRSVGDWHSTKPANEDERGGRWEGKSKTECGLHKDYFKMRAAFMAAQKKKMVY